MDNHSLADLPRHLLLVEALGEIGSELSHIIYISITVVIETITVVTIFETSVSQM